MPFSLPSTAAPRACAGSNRLITRDVTIVTVACRLSRRAALVKPRHEPQIVTNEHRQAMNLIMGSVFITLNLTQNKEQVQKKEQVRKVYRPETWWTHVRRHGGHISIRDNAAPKEEYACLGKRSLSCLSGGKPPFLTCSFLRLSKP